MEKTSQVAKLATTALKGARADFLRAIGARGSEPPTLSFLGMEFSVDQQRKVITLPENREYWRGEGGVWRVSNETPPACLFLSSVIGSTRHLSIDGFIKILTRLCEGEPWRAVSESGLANFLNLTVSEGVAHPRRDLMIWVTVAHELAAGRWDTNIHSILPALITDHDILFTSGQPHVLFSEKLMQGGSLLFAGTDEEYEEQLMRAVLHDQLHSEEIGTASIERPPILQNNLDLLIPYIRRTIFTQVAESLP